MDRINPPVATYLPFSSLHSINVQDSMIGYFPIREYPYIFTIMS